MESMGELLGIGEAIRRLRLEHDPPITQEKLAALVGVRQPTVSYWENEGGMPSVALLPKLAAVLGVSVDELLATKSEVCS